MQNKYRKFLPPKKKAQTLEDDAAAHKKYRESLPLEKKAQILEDKVNGQKKYRESLPPKKKARILKDDAAAHQKCRESLHPKKKARILENDAAAHQKHHQHHLTQEEKKTAAQIMKYAATLHNMIHLDQATAKFLWDNFFKDPTLALTYYHCCSINPHAAIFNNELGSDVDKSTMWHRFSNLIGDPIGQKEAVACQQTFRCLD